MTVRRCYVSWANGTQTANTYLFGPPVRIQCSTHRSLTSCVATPTLANEKVLAGEKNKFKMSAQIKGRARARERERGEKGGGGEKRVGGGGKINVGLSFWFD